MDQPVLNWRGYPWRAALHATIAGAVAGVALLTIIASWRSGGVDGETLFFMFGIALPVALVVAAPVGFIILPLGRFLLEKAEVYTLGRLAAVGAAAGFVLPLVVAWRLRARFVTESWAVTAIFVVAATAAGAISALLYHRGTEPERP